MDRDEVEVHKLAKKERGQYSAILTEQTWSIKDLLYMAVSHKDWELPNLRIWLAEIDIESGLDFLI